LLSLPLIFAFSYAAFMPPDACFFDRALHATPLTLSLIFHDDAAAIAAIFALFLAALIRCLFFMSPC